MKLPYTSLKLVFKQIVAFSSLWVGCGEMTVQVSCNDSTKITFICKALCSTMVNLKIWPKQISDS